MTIFINVPYRMVEANVKRITDFGIGIEIYLENHIIEEMDMNGVKEMSRSLQEHAIPCTVHAPFMDLSPGGYDRQVRRITKEKLKRSVEVANLLNARGVVCHPGYDKWRFDGNEELWLKGAVETFRDVIREARDGLIVMVENIFEEHPATLTHFFAQFKDEDLHFCFDTGHFNLFSTIPLEGWLLPLKDRIREIHLHDNHGKSDEHLPVGEGTFPFHELKQFLRHRDGIFYTCEAHEEAHAVRSIKNIKEFLS
jgi:sugar phosphate isomerase/epimerase